MSHVAGQIGYHKSETKVPILITPWTGFAVTPAEIIVIASYRVVMILIEQDSSGVRQRTPAQALVPAGQSLKQMGPFPV